MCRRELDPLTGSSQTVCQIPELVVYQIPSGFKRCLPTAILAESATNHMLN